MPPAAAEHTASAPETKDEYAQELAHPGDGAIALLQNGVLPRTTGKSAHISDGMQYPIAASCIASQIVAAELQFCLYHS